MSKKDCLVMVAPSARGRCGIDTLYDGQVRCRCRKRNKQVTRWLQEQKKKNSSVWKYFSKTNGTEGQCKLSKVTLSYHKCTISLQVVKCRSRVIRSVWTTTRALHDGTCRLRARFRHEHVDSQVLLNKNMEQAVALNYLSVYSLSRRKW